MFQTFREKPHTTLSSNKRKIMNDSRNGGKKGGTVYVSRKNPVSPLPPGLALLWQQKWISNFLTNSCRTPFMCFVGLLPSAIEAIEIRKNRTLPYTT